MTKIQTLRTDRADCIRRARFHAKRVEPRGLHTVPPDRVYLDVLHQQLRNTYVYLARTANRDLVAAKRGQQELSL